MRIPPVGTPVVYYPHAEPDNPPVAAIVVQIQKNGVASLFIMDPMGGFNYRRSVHHVSSSFLRDEGNGQLTPGALRMGAWDYLPWMVDVLGELDGFETDEEGEVNEKAIAPVMEKPKVDKRDVCRGFIRGGMDLDHVFKKVRHLGLSRRDVQAMFKEEGKLPAAELVASSTS